MIIMFITQNALQNIPAGIPGAELQPCLTTSAIPLQPPPKALMGESETTINLVKTALNSSKLKKCHK